MTRLPTGPLFRTTRVLASSGVLRDGGMKTIPKGTKVRLVKTGSGGVNTYAVVGTDTLLDRQRLLVFEAGSASERESLEKAPLILIVRTDKEMDEAIVAGACVAALVEKSWRGRNPFCAILCRDKRTAKAVAKALRKKDTPKRKRNGRPYFQCHWDVADTTTMIAFYGFFTVALG